MEKLVKKSDIHVRLQRLWKGTLFVGITGGYVLIVSLLFIYHGWQASYGFRDRGVFSDGPESVSPSDKAKKDKLERKLDRLREMAEKGQISQKAYEKTRDKYRIHDVMDDDRILGDRY